MVMELRRPERTFTIRNDGTIVSENGVVLPKGTKVEYRRVRRSGMITRHPPCAAEWKTANSLRWRPDRIASG